MIANTGKFAGKTIFISGATRGIGKAIALKLAKDKANIVIAAKTVEPHKKLAGTIFTAAKEIEAAGGQCLPIQTDIRDEESVMKAIEKTVSQFGGLDVLVNNASAIHITDTLNTPMKRYDLMHTVNTRGTFMTTKYAVPHLKKSTSAHVLNLSPPLVMNARWFKANVAYTMAKYGMSMCALGMAEEFRADKIAVNALWPKTAIYTAAMEMLGGGESVSKMCRNVDIISDAAYVMLSKGPEFTGNFVVDEELLRAEGVTDFEKYSCVPGNKLLLDGFLPDKMCKEAGDGFIQMGDGFTPADDATGGATSGPDTGAAAKIFKKVKEMMSDDLKKEINGLIVFTISGKNWYMDSSASRPFQISESELDTKADVTMTTDEDTFEKMAKGELKPTGAFMGGKLKIKGNMAVAMKAEKLFGQLKAKL